MPETINGFKIEPKPVSAGPWAGLWRVVATDPATGDRFASVWRWADEEACRRMIDGMAWRPSPEWSPRTARTWFPIGDPATLAAPIRSA